MRKNAAMLNEYEIRDGIVYMRLKQGLVTRFDASDLMIVDRYVWYCAAIKTCKYAQGLATLDDGSTRTIFMHRAIMSFPSDGVIDHIDRDGLNNCRSNLRVVSQRVNCHNRNLNSNNRSGFKGVRWDPVNRRWISQIWNSTNEYIGSFDCRIEAAQAYDQRAVETRGLMGLMPHALNFPDRFEALMTGSFGL